MSPLGSKPRDRRARAVRLWRENHPGRVHESTCHTPLTADYPALNKFHFAVGWHTNTPGN